MRSTIHHIGHGKRDAIYPLCDLDLWDVDDLSRVVFWDQQFLNEIR